MLIFEWLIKDQQFFDQPCKDQHSQAIAVAVASFQAIARVDLLPSAHH